jgi:hypothetical protein
MAGVPDEDAKEGRYLIALAHEGTMGKRYPSTHWLSMGFGGRIPPLLVVNDPRANKEGRYLIAHAHEGTMGKRLPATHWLSMGHGGSASAAP